MKAPTTSSLQLGLGLEVLAEIQVTEFAVDLNEVIELLHVQLVGIVDVAEVLLRDRAGFAPAVLDLAELREGVLHIALFVDEGLQVLDDGLLLHEVALALGIELAVVLRALLLIRIVEGLETGLDRGERAHGRARQGFGRSNFLYGIGIGFIDRRILAGLRLFAGQALVEGGLDGLGLLGTFHPVSAFRQFLEQSGQFGQGLLAEIDHRFLRLFHGFLLFLLHFLLHFLHDRLLLRHFLRFFGDFFSRFFHSSFDNFFHSLFHGFLGRFLCYI